MVHLLTSVLTIYTFWIIASSLSIYPHSLSYFNELVGGPLNGANHLLGSNVDWGQNLHYLQMLDGEQSAISLLAYSSGIFRCLFAGGYIRGSRNESFSSPGIEIFIVTDQKSREELQGLKYGMPEPGSIAINLSLLHDQSRLARARKTESSRSTCVRRNWLLDSTPSDHIGYLLVVGSQNGS